MKAFQSNGFVWWNEQEIELRESLVRQLTSEVRKTLAQINPSIQVFRVETPCLMPLEWAKGHLPMYRAVAGKEEWERKEAYALRGESTKGTYTVMDELQSKLPVCLYQVNKSFRDEESSAMRLSQYRLREFYQIEFQVFYSETTKVDIHQKFVDTFTNKFGLPVELTPDDLPPYSARTTDLEIDGVEVASLSTRKDYKVPVFEISFGLDRLVMLLGGEKKH